MTDQAPSTVVNRHARPKVAPQHPGIEAHFDGQHLRGRGKGNRIHWSPAWAALGRDFEAFLARTHSRQRYVWIAREVKLTVAFLGVTPDTFRPETLPAIQRRLASLPRQVRMFAKPALRHLVTFLTFSGAWPRELGGHWVRPYFIAAHLDPAWHTLLTNAHAAWKKRFRSLESARIRFHLITECVWWQRLRPGGPITVHELVTHWNAYLAAVMTSTQKPHNQRRAPLEAFIAFVEMLRAAGWLKGPLPTYHWIEPNFWFPLAYGVRRAAERLLAIEVATPESELRARLLRYVLGAGFGYLAGRFVPPHPPTSHDYAKVRAMLQKEHYEPAEIEQALGDARQVLTLVSAWSHTTKRLGKRPENKGG